jgi:hypothetical protein
MTLRSRRIPRSPQSEYRHLRRESDGSLYDLDERRRISGTELRDDIQAGRRFRAIRHDSGADCTSEVLAEALRGAVADRLGAGTGLPAGLAALASTVLSALDTRDETGAGGALRATRSSRGVGSTGCDDDQPSAYRRD